MNLPTMFISHGSPDLAVAPSPARSFLMEAGTQIGKPQAILMISAHWTTRIPMISATNTPQTIHDFFGFPEELYQISYPAKCSFTLANQVSELLTARGIAHEFVSDRGFDHGVWNPLMLMYPSADIPIVQLSLQPRQSPRYHLEIGQALASLRSQGVLIIGSGSATHNLKEMGKYEHPPHWVTEFVNWLNEKVINFDLDDLLDYPNLAPHAKRNHPTPEHLLPLFMVIGAAGENPRPSLLHSSYTYGVLSMASFAFSSPNHI